MPEGVWAERLSKKLSQPGEKLVKFTPTGVLELLEAKGAMDLYTTLRDEIIRDCGGNVKLTVFTDRNIECWDSSKIQQVYCTHTRTHARTHARTRTCTHASQTVAFAANTRRKITPHIGPHRPASARIATSVIFCVAGCGGPGGAQGGAPDPRKPPGRAPLLFFPGPPRQMPRVLVPQPCRCGRPKPPAGGFTSDNRDPHSTAQMKA